jgi:hypothetical protein
MNYVQIRKSNNALIDYFLLKNKTFLYFYVFMFLCFYVTTFRILIIIFYSATLKILYIIYEKLFSF